MYRVCMLVLVHTTMQPTAVHSGWMEKPKKGAHVDACVGAWGGADAHIIYFIPLSIYTCMEANCLYTVGDQLRENSTKTEI